MFVNSKKPGSSHDATAIEGTNLFYLISNSVLPDWVHAVGDDATEIQDLS